MTSNVPTSFVRAYLRASTAEQDASRAWKLSRLFAGRGLIICSYYIENESGTVLSARNFFVFWDCQQNDICLSRMWTDFPACQGKTGIRWKWSGRKTSGLGRVNVPTTWINSGMSEFDSRLFAAINDMLLDMLAAVARRDYEQRQERQKQGIEKAKKDGKYKGRKPNQSQTWCNYQVDRKR